MVLDSPRDRGMEQLPVKELLVREGLPAFPAGSSFQGLCLAQIPVPKVLLALGFLHGIAWKRRVEQLCMEISSHPHPSHPENL